MFLGDKDGVLTKEKRYVGKVEDVAPDYELDDLRDVIQILE